MLGCIIGDIAGSTCEFDEFKSKDFPLFQKGCDYTDDTIMTVAVAEALLRARAEQVSFREVLVEEMQGYGRMYPHPQGAYGGRFAAWLQTKDPRPYNSFGNGSAMRVAAAGWLFDTLDKTLEMAKVTAEVTHNHPEGIKGAEATASAIYLARTGSTKAEIKAYIEEQFGYDLSRTCDEIRPTYRHVESCQETVPEAITAFLEGDSFENVIRTAASLGGDCDTLTCIAGSMAEGFYGVPEELKRQCRQRLPQELLSVLLRFDSALHR